MSIRKKMKQTGMHFINAKECLIHYARNNYALSLSACSREKGFTLIEIMIALIVLMTGMLGVLGMQYYAVGGNVSSKDMRVATNISQQLIEQFNAVPYASLASGSDVEPVPAVETSLSGGIIYTRTYWVHPNCIALQLDGDDGTCNPALAASCLTDPDAALATASSAIRVRTCWTDKNNTNRSVTLNTLRWDENVTP
ncbi:MAG: prepilin-type N-terminal cleavage/methylation domain-containing protein [Nitrospiraceae bacterium]|nr:MAG: prepilin-type N-terminal cleavage/methylation domain-containing protein [Nitrospiraceae bacterium]